MARDKSLVELRNAALRQEYERLRKQKVKGKQKYTTAFILHKLSTTRFFISVERIEQILWKNR